MNRILYLVCTYMELKYLSSQLLGHGVFLLSIQENMHDGPLSGKVDLIEDHECDDNDRQTMTNSI